MALSSTAAIARFWGFNVPVMVAAKAARNAKPKPSIAGVTFQAKAEGRMPGGVRAVIMKSLKSAGLLKP